MCQPAVRLPQLVQRLLERDVAVEIIGPMAAQTLQPLPFDQALYAYDDLGGLAGLGRQCVRKIDAAQKAERDKPCGVQFQGRLSCFERTGFLDKR